jgi:Domain of unknown function (DUF4129)
MRSRSLPRPWGSRRLHILLLVVFALSSQVERGSAATDRPVPLSLPRAIGGDVLQDDAARGSEVDAVLRSVLARPEFQRRPSSIWLESIRKRVGDWVARMLRRLTGTGVSARTVGVVLAWASSLLALSFLSWWLVQMLTRRSRAASLELSAIRPPAAAAREWAQRAMAAARAGDFRESVRCGYRAALCRLDEQGVWRVDESRTPREYVRLLPAGDSRFDVVSDLTRQFEQVWYGRRTPTDEDARLLAAHLERLGCLRAADRAI